jgi:nitroreductase
MKLNSLIEKRYSPRAFNSKQLTNNEIRSLFEASRWAASSRNQQPWRFIYATPNQVEEWEKLFDCLIDFNKGWVKTAPFLMLVLAQKIDPLSGKERTNVAYDIGLAMGNFTYQATAMGLYLRNMGGFSTEQVIKNFNIPEIYEPIVMVAAGYLGDEKSLDDQFKVPKDENRERKPLESIIFDGNWDSIQ